MAYYNPENREPLLWGTVAVLLYVTMLIVVMAFVSFTQITTDPSAEGILVDFGETISGDGLEELTSTDVAATPPPIQEMEQESIETDPQAEVALEEQRVESPTKEPTPQREQPIEQRDTVIVEERVVNQNALFPGRGEQSSATSQGSTATSGNQGSESGTVGGAAEGSVGVGDQPTFELAGRSVVGSLPLPTYGANVSGRVIIDITVDEGGTVTSATYRAQGSTTNNSQLVAAAREAALKARFTPSDDFIQGGSITYVFKMN